MKLNNARIIILLVIIIININENLAQNLSFNNLSIGDGLSDPIVNEIIQDNDGYLWFCTQRGLNRYDGYSIETFYHIPNDSNSLINSTTNCVEIDDNGDLWIGTKSGLSRYIRNRGIFESVTFDGSTQLNNIRAIYFKSDSIVWLGTSEGLIKFNPLNDTYRIYQQGSSAMSLSHNIVRAISEDNNGNLWVGTFDGLNKFDPFTETFLRFKFTTPHGSDLVNNLIISLQLDKTDSLLWVGTQTGLALLNVQNGSYKIFRKELGYGGQNAIKTIFGPHNNQLWLGTDEGLMIFEIDKERFTTYRHNPIASNSISNDVVTDIYKDKSGVLWFGTNDGLSSFNLQRKKFNFYPIVRFNDKNETLGAEIKAIYKQDNGNLWLGGSSGLIKIDADGKQKWFTKQMNIGLESNIINNIYEDLKGNLWVCTTGGLNLYQPEKDRFLYFDIQADARVSRYASSILEFAPNKYIVGSSGAGLLKFETNSTLLIQGKVPDPQFLFLSDTYQISNIIRGKGDNVWIISGTDELFNYNIKSDSIEKSIIPIVHLFKDEDSQVKAVTRNGLYNLEERPHLVANIGYLGDIAIKGVEKDDNSGNLWIATTNSIIVLNASREIDSRYMVGTDLQIKSFVNNSTFKDKDGILYFGGIDGYISFNPEEIHEDDFISTPLITKITINNNDLSPKDKFGEKKLNGKVVHQLERLDLKYNENSIEFSFSPFHFASPKSNQFSYILENFDDNWRTTDGHYPKVLYSNLAPGNYHFKLKAANPDGIWSNGTRDIEIRIDPPWWAAPYSFVSYILVMTIVGILAVRQTRIRTKLKSDLRYEQLNHERDAELHQLKMKFFTNISHEIRTPLTLILGPLEKLMRQISDKAALSQLDMMQRNAIRLLRLINQIMDMRKMEKGELEFTLENGDLISVVKDVHTYFKQLAGREHITYSFNSNKSTLNCRFDYDKIDKILFNLITNAFKFSGRNGKVEVNVMFPVEKEGKEMVEVSVKDSGKGIPKEQLSNIFERFYQVGGVENNLQNGTGIGLSMSSDYAKLHGGSLFVESTINMGSTFYLRIPFLPIESNEEIRSQIDRQHVGIQSEDKHLKSLNDDKNTNVALPLILVVEDNSDMRSFICGSLTGRFQIIEAENGEIGFELARKYNPQLIISDVMMPIMNGLELCNQIKSEFETCHIPVILLTAKNSPESILKGLKEGADDYITKPFFINQLLARVENLINSRKILIDKLNRGELSNLSDIALTGIDEKFIAEVVQVIEAHISDAELNIGFLSKSMGMSHSALYKKIKSITGLSGNGFIRKIRLKKAKQLLKNPEAHISDVVYQVGFNNRSYFSKCFHQMYGMTPSGFTSQVKQIS